MINIITALIILALIIGAVVYMVKAKKKGVKCIGCSAAGNCSAQRGCSCGSTDKRERSE